MSPVFCGFSDFIDFLFVSSLPYRYNEDFEIEDAVHTAILTLKVPNVANSNVW